MGKKNYLVRWNLSDISYVKISFNGQVRNGNGISEYIIRNRTGILIVDGVFKIRNVLIIMEEVIILRNGVKVYELGFRKLEIEGDNNIVI